MTNDDDVRIAKAIAEKLAIDEINTDMLPKSRKALVD